MYHRDSILRLFFKVFMIVSASSFTSWSHIRLEVQQRLDAVLAVSALRDNRRAGLNESSCSVTALGSSRGDRSSGFVNAEGRIVPLGFLKESGEGSRRKEVVGRVTLLFIPPQSSIMFVDNTFVP